MINNRPRSWRARASVRDNDEVAAVSAVKPHCPITEPDALRTLCGRLAASSVIAVDTEFMRDTTYWPQLCLLQVATEDEAWCVDPFALDLAPLFEVFTNHKIMKVFHAARQDLEIFFKLMGELPQPVFDTQVAAMLCGFGDSISYDALVARLACAQVDKSARVTDWSRRPLSERQIAYALADVVHLPTIYEKLLHRLQDRGRAAWAQEEMRCLVTPEKCHITPENAWKRLKIDNMTRTMAAKTFMIARDLTAWREREAQSRDIPRQHVLRDDTLVEIATLAPSTVADLERVRRFNERRSRGETALALIKVVQGALATPKDQWPRCQQRPEPPTALVDMLRLLLKTRCYEHDVAPTLVANSADLKTIAIDDQADVMALNGWRNRIFGSDAIALKRGQLALRLSQDGRNAEVVTLS